jgi:3-oxoacyl-[acyl-carrier-protein] synthase-3
MEKVLGAFLDKPSRAKRVVLGSNLIKTRYYAIDPETRKSTHSNAELAAQAIKTIINENPSLNLKDVDLLCCGTTTPDLLAPAHGQMVQGLLPELCCEVISTSGVCCSSMAAFKSAFAHVLSGQAERALVTGSETASKYMRSEFLESECPAKISALEKDPMLAFEHDFLRWMLSDGSGAVYLSAEPLAGNTNLKINWIEGRSFANENPVCMFAGGHKGEGGEVTSWKDLRLNGDDERLKFAMNLQQDVRQLKEGIAYYTVERVLPEIKKKHGLRAGDYNWFLPHYSSHYFRQTLVDVMAKCDFSIPEERWFTSLYDKGNVGSASMFVFINDLVRSGKLVMGDKILCYVPESARFSVYYFELEVV